MTQCGKKSARMFPKSKSKTVYVRGAGRMHYILVCVAHLGCLSQGQWLADFPQAKIKAVRYQSGTANKVQICAASAASASPMGGGQRTRASLCVYNWTPPHQTDFKATEALRWLFMQRVR